MARVPQHHRDTSDHVPAQAAGVRIEVLGPLRLVIDGEPVDVPGPRRRAVLAVLTMAAGRAVSIDTLIDAVWPDSDFGNGSGTTDGGLASTKRALHSHVSRIRGHLGRYADVLEREGNAYRLRVEPTGVDAAEVQLLRAQARDVVADRPDEAARTLSRALTLWRGTALDEFADVAPLAIEARRLASSRTDLIDEWLEARLASGGDPELVADASRALADEPLRERTATVLVRALAIQGRGVDALRAAHDFRRTLGEETGLDPSAAFARLEQDIASGQDAPSQGAQGAQGEQRGQVVRPAAARLTDDAGATARHRRLTARPSSPLVGRSEQLDTVRHDLASSPLVTLVGPGGVGKTRLALEVLADLTEAGEHTTHLLELATVEDDHHLNNALASVLQLNIPDESTLIDAAAEVLAATPTVLLIDNCEHLAEACRAVISDLLRFAPGLTVLATSREPLGLSEERVVRLGPLAIPDPIATITDQSLLVDLAHVPSVEAFCAHVRRRSPDFQLTIDNSGDVADIVRQLDGLPLALELAAGRVASLGVRDVHHRLERALDLVGGSRSEGNARHRTLRSTIEWSFRLLTEEERELVCALAVFPGGLDLDGIEWLAEDLGLPGDPAALTARLVEASVVVADRRRVDTRYRLLETVRVYGIGQLVAGGDHERIERSIVRWAVALAERLERQAAGPNEEEAARRLATELPNLRAAHDHAVRFGDTDSLVALVSHLEELGLYRVHPELNTWTIELGEQLRDSTHPQTARALAAAARAAWLRGRPNDSIAFADAALRLVTTERERARALDALGIVAGFDGDFDRSCALLVEAAETDQSIADLSLATAAMNATYAKDAVRARALLARAVAAEGEHPRRSRQAFRYYVQGEVAAHLDDDLERAIDEYQTAIELSRSVEATFVQGVATVGLVSVWARLGRVAEARDGFRWLIDYWRKAGNWTQMWTTLRNLAVTLAETGDAEYAALILAAADHAEGASNVDATTEAQQEQLRDRLREQLGPHEYDRIRQRGMVLPRASVIDEALDAVARTT